jgi:hypothetical protein
MSSRPLIPNEREYLQHRKVVSIHSEDRDMVKFPSSASFEIELPQDYVNVEGVKLLSWAFPSNYSVFTSVRKNIDLVFKITDAYNPGDPAHGLYSPIQSAIFAGLYANAANNYFLTIEEGFYNPSQMAMEMQNKMNESVNKYLIGYIATNYPALQSQYVTYERFVVVYNSVNQKLWFGNKTDAFTMINVDDSVYGVHRKYKDTCSSRGTLPQYANWGLPAYLGFNRVDALSSGSIIPPRFYYGDVVQSGDDGFWLIPDTTLPGSIVQYLVAPFKINLMGDAYFYIEIDGLNGLDETSPYSLSNFTMHTNETNGIVRSAFAKIAVCTTPISQWFDRSNDNYKWFSPPAERIRRLKIKIRYHDNELVSFGHFDWSLSLEFRLLTPQINRKYHAVMPEIMMP